MDWGKLSYREKIIWAAGFLDGEAYIGVDDSQRIDCGQKAPEPLHWLNSLVPGTLWLNKTAGCMYWLITGAKARGFMMMIYPFMTERRQEQIRRAIFNGPLRWRVR